MAAIPGRIRIKHAIRGPWWLDGEQREGPPPAGVFDGDHWDATTGRVVERAVQPPIVGVLDFTNKTKYGFSSRGVRQYLFHPLDIRYPPMIVGSRAEHRINQLAVVSTANMAWNTTKAKWPQAGLQQILGPVGDPVVEQEALRRQVLRGVGKTAVVPAAISGVPTCSGPIEDWPTCFNIDPVGCRDVDDILAWRELPDGSTEFAIAIANVAALVPAGSELDAYARARLQTVYDPAGSVIDPMLPTAISEGAGSLLADGVARGVVAAVWRFGSEGRSGVCCEPEWRVFSVVNRRTYSYESVLEDGETCRKLRNLLGVATGLQDVGEDPHKWIEYAMLTYNAAAARRLVAAGAGILRRHRGAVGAEELRGLALATAVPALAFLGFAAGEYVDVLAGAAAAAVGEDVSHVGLGLAVYCHASSPLRRYADLANQRILIGSSCASAMETAITPAMLNERAKEIKAYERAAWCLQNLSASTLSAAEGWVIGWTPGAAEGEVKIRIYVPQWSRTCRIIMRSPTVGLSADTMEVGRRDGEGGCWECRKGQKVHMTAFWDVRAPPEGRFVFRVDP